MWQFVVDSTAFLRGEDDEANRQMQNSRIPTVVPLASSSLMEVKGMVGVFESWLWRGVLVFCR